MEKPGCFAITYLYFHTVLRSLVHGRVSVFMLELHVPSPSEKL